MAVWIQVGAKSSGDFSEGVSSSFYFTNLPEAEKSSKYSVDLRSPFQIENQILQFTHFPGMCKQICVFSL